MEYFAAEDPFKAARKAGFRVLIAAFIISLAALVLSVVILCFIGSGIAIID